MSNRTKKDEADYVANIRREDDIKTEVIVELRKSNKGLREDRRRLLESLIMAQDALRVYRVAALELTIQAIEAKSDCIPSCKRHRWDDVDGWHRTDEKVSK